MSRIIFATGNQNKMREIREIMQGFRVNGEEIEILSMKEAGVYTDIVEDGMTFVENASIKAKAIAVLAPGDFVMADDSGLEIDALNKEPGIYSARYLGEDTSYQIKNANLIERLNGVPDEKRTARFVCAIAAVMRTEHCLQLRVQSREESVMKNGERTDSDMTRSFWFHLMCRPLRS